MPAFTYTPIDGDTINLGLYTPGFDSDIAGRWGRHAIPGQRGDLKEDLAEGSLVTRVMLQFVGKTQNDYYTVIPAMSKSRRGTLQHGRRGARPTVITRFSEKVEYTTRGESTIVSLEFEDAILN